MVPLEKTAIYYFDFSLNSLLKLKGAVLKKENSFKFRLRFMATEGVNL